MSNTIETSGALAQTVCDALRDVVDPELGMNVVDLGLVYRVQADASRIAVEMTMTSPGCPMGESIVEDARAAIAMALPDVPELSIELVWDPPWTPDRMEEQARGFFGW
jgi:metal-sulfur cluster biosynthetic enzyme